MSERQRSMIGERIDLFRSKLASMLHKASLSHRRESLWDKLIASRSESSTASRQEVRPTDDDRA